MQKHSRKAFAPTPRLTLSGAFLVALVISVPVFAILTLAEVLWL